ncbi:MAG: MAPEG family protein [Pseudomonadota bacterium]
MEILTIVSMLALMQVIVLGWLTGMARVKYSVSAPATTGNEHFERYYRVHYNTIEQLVVFLPALWAFGYYIGQYWAAGLGLLYLLGRIAYAVGYIRQPASRGPGMLLTMIATSALVIGALAGALLQL